MAGKHGDDADNRALDIFYGSQAVDALLYLGLYTDSSEPADGAALTDLTEPVGGGYARITLTRGTSWTVLVDLAYTAVQTFTSSGAAWGNVYGYFVATSADNSGIIWLLEHFSDGPYNNIDGGQISVQVRDNAA